MSRPDGLTVFGRPWERNEDGMPTIDGESYLKGDNVEVVWGDREPDEVIEDILDAKKPGQRFTLFVDPYEQRIVNRVSVEDPESFPAQNDTEKFPGNPDYSTYLIDFQPSSIKEDLFQAYYDAARDVIIDGERFSMEEPEVPMYSASTHQYPLRIPELSSARNLLNSEEIDAIESQVENGNNVVIGLPYTTHREEGIDDLWRTAQDLTEIGVVSVGTIGYEEADIEIHAAKNGEVSAFNQPAYHALDSERRVVYSRSLVERAKDLIFK